MKWLLFSILLSTVWGNTILFPSNPTTNNPLTITYSVTNPYDYTIKILRHGTAFGNYASFLKVSFNGTLLPYDGIRGYYDRRPEYAYLILCPGESKSITLNLEDSFNMELPGEYQCWFEEAINSPIPLEAEQIEENMLLVHIHQDETTKKPVDNLLSIFEEPSYIESNRTNNIGNKFLSSQNTTYNISALPQKFLSRSNALTINKMEKTVRKRSKGLANIHKEEEEKEEHHQSEEENANISTYLQYQELIKNRLRMPVQNMIQKGINYLNDHALSYPPLFTKWFDGAPTSYSKDFVVSHLNTMLTKISTVSFKVAFPTSEQCAQHNAVAFWLSSDPSWIQMCDIFFPETIPFMGILSPSDVSDQMFGQVLTIIHEMTHVAGVYPIPPDKETYYRSECLELAKTNSNKAIHNSQNYAWFFNNLAYTVEFTSIFNYGLRTNPGTGTKWLYSDNQVSPSGNLKFECEGEFPFCNLREKSTGLYLAYDHRLVEEDRIILSSTKTDWTIQYLGNGASALKYGLWGDRVKLISNQLVEDSQIGTWDYSSLWMVTLDGVPPNTRTVQITDSGYGSIFKAEDDYIVDSAIICKDSTAKKLELVIMGDPSKCVLRVKGTHNLFLNRRVLTDLVKLYDQPYWWKYERDVTTGKYNMVCLEKTGQAKLYCADTWLNSGYVYTDGWFTQRLIFTDIAVGTL